MILLYKRELKTIISCLFLKKTENYEDPIHH